MTYEQIKIMIQQYLDATIMGADYRKRMPPEQSMMSEKHVGSLLNRQAERREACINGERDSTDFTIFWSSDDESICRWVNIDEPSQFQV